MKILDERIYERAEAILKSVYGENASFREGQYEAIESVFVRRKSLIVQKTGWGKSLVYFIATRLNRENGEGVTFVVSPLLSLMRNQIDAANRVGLRCDVLNTETKDRREEILTGIKNDEYDIVLITPETLFSEDVQRELSSIRIGLFVVDEAHCISDWGHDFRLEFGRLNQVVRELTSKVPILATTATANDRVVADLERQLGEGVYVSRGSLYRESLAIQVMKMSDKAERYAWILRNVNKLTGSGIIYCLTIRDCEYLTSFLRQNGVNALSYHSDMDKKEKGESIEVLEKFHKNLIKILVATTKLGMGYDKDDIGFVIHYQRPANIVNYYQQIGRAGRNLSYAHIFLLTGSEDDEIQNYFINAAFPYQYEAEGVLQIIENNPDCTEGFVMSKANLRFNRVRNTIKFLEYEGFIIKNGSKYIRSPKPFKYNGEYYKAIQDIRFSEQNQMRALIDTKECYSKFIINSLDDDSDFKCGKCANCLGHDIISRETSLEEKELAARFINLSTLEIIPRFRWAKTEITDQKKIEFQNDRGLCLARWGDIGYGEIIKNCKKNNLDYPENIVQRAFEIALPIVKEKGIRALVPIPTKGDSLLAGFAQRLADKLGIDCKPLLIKTKDSHQREMQNSSYQCYNALTAYDCLSEVPNVPILLLDDVISSGWTLTVCGYKLMQRGATSITPIVLADIKQAED